MSLKVNDCVRQLGRTIAETLVNEPGIDQRTMGPAPARPVLRGLSGDRLLVLEDGERTGDLSATSADHAVVIEPMTAERVEVIRGPEALLYGSNTIGGVINVDRGYVPTTNLDHWHGTVSYQGESVNNGHSSGIKVNLPAGPFSMHVDASMRNTQDIKTPKKKLLNTSIITNNASLGMSIVRPWGLLGVAGSLYDSEYGIPGGFIGAHKSGVDVELNRRHFEAKSEFYFQNDWIKRVNARYNFSRYYHLEREANGIPGIEFGVLNYNFSLMARLKDHPHFKNGEVGLWSEYRDFAAGVYAFTPQAVEKKIAGFAFQEFILGRFGIKAALRYDVLQVIPQQEKYDKKIGYIQNRNFSDFSGSFAAIYEINRHLHYGTTVMKSFRSPGIEELYSRGPHLAAYSFEIGNPSLGKEQGIGIETFLHFEGQPGNAQIALFRNNISGYVFPKNTGQLDYSTLLPVYQYSGSNVIIEGCELAFELLPWQFIAFSGSMSYVYGEMDSGEAMPLMPPLHGKLDVQLLWNQTTIGFRARAADEQTRLGRFEEYTAGFTVYDLMGQYLLNVGHYLSSINLTIENITNQEYRKHLSRVKAVMPEPGRNVKLLFRIYF